MNRYEPNGWTMAGAFDLYNLPSVGDFLVAGLYCYGDGNTWEAFAESTEDGANLGSYLGSSVPKGNGLTKFEIPSEDKITKAAGNFFEGQSGGVENEWGQNFDSVAVRWSVWNWNYGIDDWVAGDYDGWVGQYNLKSNTYFVFIGSFQIMELTRAATIAATLVVMSSFISFI